MAKIGEGDPRWIVEAREDGKNVNQWHWTEIDYTNWVKNRLCELLENLAIESENIFCKTHTLTMSGEVSVNTRKQKTIIFYELDVTLKWEGSWHPSKTEGKGTVKLPYISEENDPSDFEIQISVEEENTDRLKLRDEFRSKIIPILKERIPIMIAELREVTTNHTKLPPKQQPSAKLLDKMEITPTTTPTSTPIPTPTSKPTSSPTPTATTEKKDSKPMQFSSFTLKEKFVCSPRDLFECFLHPGRVKAYAGGDALINADQGCKFKLFGGSVEGENVEVIVGKKIVQKWRFNSWPPGIFSTVTIELEEKEGKTLLKLTQTGVPEDDKERTEAGWDANFFRRIKGVFGYGPMI